MAQWPTCRTRTDMIVESIAKKNCNKNQMGCLLGGGGLVWDTNLELKLLTSWSWWQFLLSLEAPEITDGLLELGMPIFELKFLISSCRCFSSCIKSECFKSGMDLVLLLGVFLSDFLYVWEGMWSCCTRKKIHDDDPLLRLNCNGISKTQTNFT